MTFPDNSDQTSQKSPPLTDNSILGPSSGSSGVAVDESYDLYDLRYIAKIQEESSSSFLPSYARGEWDPQATPELPDEFRSTLEPKLLSHEHEAGPPEILQSVKESYRSYLDSSIPNATQVIVNASTTLIEGSEADLNVFGRDFQSATGTYGIVRPVEASEVSIPSSPTSSSSCIMTGFSLDVVRRFESAGFLEPPMPLEEESRRAAVSQYRPFAQTLEANFDRILRLAKLIFSADNAAITFVDTDYIHVLTPGSDPIRVPRRESMCGHAILIRK